MMRRFLLTLWCCFAFGGWGALRSPLTAQDEGGPLEFVSTTFPNDAPPHSGVLADVSGDGRIDLVIANGPHATVGVLIQDANRNFGDPELVSIDFGGKGSELISIVGGFFNADENLDVAVSDLRNNKVHVLINNGDGTFGPDFQSVDTGSRPFMVTTADITGDGNADLITANSGGNNISVLAGDGLGGFTPAGPDIRVGSRPVAVAAGDFDGDGDQDVAVADEVSADITLLSNQGGTLTESGLLFVLGRPAFIIAVDIDSDANLDLLMADGQEPSVTVFFGTGAGQFSAGTAVPTGSPSFSVSSADVDLDGFPDIVTANAATDTVSFVRGLGKGAFDVPLILEAGTTPRVVLAEDIDGDNDLDLVACNRTSEDLTFYTNQENSPEPTSVLFRRGDVDGNGILIIGDPILLLNHLFLGATPIPCQKAADADDLGDLGLSDAVSVLNFLFLGGPPPAEPFTECGEDSTEDLLTCDAFDGCAG